MINVAIIGAGATGSRHLQALAHLEEDAVIHVVDPSEESRQIAKERFGAIDQKADQNFKLLLHSTIDCLNGPLDLALIATGSDVRANLIRTLIKRVKVRNMLLEKVLFQKEADYIEIQELLKKENVSAWVNCYRRDTDFFKSVKVKLDLSEKIKISVRGSLWGIGCLGVHFIDLLAFFSGHVDFEFRKSQLNKKLLDAKRKGFKEFTGVIEGVNSRGDSLIMDSKDHGNQPWVMSIENGKTWQKISEVWGSADYKYFDGKTESQCRINIPMQSKRTHILVKQIIHENHCDLPDFNDSVTLHIPLIRVLIKHLQQTTGEKVEACPIT
jgi:hypothetical protein